MSSPFIALGFGTRSTFFVLLCVHPFSHPVSFLFFLFSSIVEEEDVWIDLSLVADNTVAHSTLTFYTV